jgi:CheY-like chemotaxis protein
MQRPNSGQIAVLIVDDFDDNRALYAEYASICGFRVLEASDGQEAIDKAVRAQPHVIVLDLCLPKISGLEVIQRLKRDPRTSRIPILVVTGHATDGHTQDAWDAGCDALLTKPCLPDKLVDSIRDLLEEDASQRVAETA